ncbi:MAG: hypothetical protein HY289_08940 [Planctomycetes bacterium]|nr:hypothetical protein [Planctomycetota bacterium]
MNTSILTIALASALLVGNNAAPSWQTSYTAAQTQVTAQKKPMVVVFGSGANGWAKLVRAEAPALEVSRLLAEQYVCVYVDTSAPQGQKLASDFGIAGGVGLVISDRSGESQAFWHQGDMSNDNLSQYLKKYADPTVAVQRTETTGSARTSYYQAPSTQYQGSIRSANC